MAMSQKKSPVTPQQEMAAAMEVDKAHIHTHTHTHHTHRSSSPC